MNDWKKDQIADTETADEVASSGLPVVRGVANFVNVAGSDMNFYHYARLRNCQN
jgi:hypothetical protein